MATEREKIIKRVRALQAKTLGSSCTEQEAMAAAEKAGELMERYNLAAADVKEIEADRYGKRAREWHKSRVQPISKFCTVAIARYTDTRFWSSPHKRTATFFGELHDTANAWFLLDLVERSINQSWDRDKKAVINDCRSRGDQTHGRTLRKTYCIAMAIRINERLNAMSDKREEGQSVQQATGTSLVIVKKQLVDCKFRGLGLSLRSAGKTRWNPNETATNAGKRAGERVNFGRPVGNSSGPTMLH